MEEAKGVIRIVNLVLLESRFKRENNVVQDDKEKVEVGIGVNPGFDAKLNRVVTQVSLQTNSTREGEKQYEAQITYSGHFEAEDITEQTLEEFAKVNAPAIIFPFVREQLMTLTLKAGLKPVILHPVNFVQLAEKTIPEEKQLSAKE